MLNMQKQFKKNEDILYEKIDDTGMLLYNNISKETHLLNQTATIIFELCDGKKDIKEI